MITTFPLSKIQRLRRNAEKASQSFYDCQEGWSISRDDPGEVLAAFKTLRLKPGFVLRAYQFRAGGNGNGFVWAMPESAELPHPELCPRLEGFFLDPPKPPDALANYMEAIEGDSTPFSYLSASILARELAEFGAMWHGCSWSVEEVLGDDPWTMGAKKPGFLAKTEEQWSWEGPKPENWEPAAERDGDAVTVVFLTYSELYQQRIYRICDRFKPGSYVFETEKQVIAAGQGGCCP